jgi:hypothetical protein
VRLDVRQGSLRSGALAAVLGVLLSLGILGANPAAAQTGSAAPGGSLVLTAQDAWAPAGGAFTMHVLADGVARNGLALTLTVHDRLTRSAFDASLAGGSLGPTLNLVSVPFDSLPTTSDGSRVVTVGLQSAADQSSAKLAARKPGGGVYPLEVQLRDSDDTTVVPGFVTYLSVAEVAPTTPGSAPTLASGRPLDVAWVWPLVDHPAYLADGSVDPAVLADLGPNGRLGRQAAAIGADGDVPLTLAPNPETLEAWEALTRQHLDVAPGIGALVAAPAHHEVLSGPFVPLDTPTLLARGFPGAPETEYNQGVSTLDRVLGARLDPRTALPGRLDVPTLQFLRGRGVDRVIVADTEHALSPVDERYTPAHPFTIQASPGDPSSAMTLLTGDSRLEQQLSGDDPPALRAARILAGLALVEGEQPSIQRGVVLVNPTLWDPPSDFLDAMLSGLRGNPFVSPVTLDTLVSNVPVATANGQANGDPVVRSPQPAPPSAPPVTTDQWAKGTASLSAVQQLFGTTDARAVRGQRSLDSSLTSLWETPDGRARARALVAGVGTSVNTFLGHIRAPSNSTVNITSSRAEIPVTLRNDTGQPVAVHVALASDKLLFPDGADRDITLPPRNTTVRFTVETRSGGTFPVQVSVTTSGGGLPIQTTQMTVRSTFVSGVGIFLTVAAVVVLAAWWGYDIYRRRRSRRVAAPSGQPA